MAAEEATEEELSKAALQIQSAHRGKAARAEVDEKKAAARARAAAEEQRLHLSAAEELDLESVLQAEASGRRILQQAKAVEAEAAAVKIQAVHRGKTDRRAVHEKRERAVAPAAASYSEPAAYTAEHTETDADDGGGEEWNDAEYDALQAKLAKKREELQERMSRLEVRENTFHCLSVCCFTAVPGVLTAFPCVLRGRPRTGQPASSRCTSRPTAPGRLPPRTRRP